MGQASTLFYIRLVNDSYNDKHSNNAPAFTLFSTDFEAINNLLPHRSASLDEKIARYLKAMLDKDIACIVIPNITIHETVDAVWDDLDSPIPLAHPISGTIKRMSLKNKTKAVLFGSRYTMNSDYIKTAFANSEIDIKKPKPKDLEFIDFVRRQVYSEIASKATLQKFNDLVQHYSDESTVLLSCSELSLASKIKNENVLDMADIQVEDAISLINL